jgi:hypothetical protein
MTNLRENRIHGWAKGRGRTSGTPAISEREMRQTRRIILRKLQVRMRKEKLICA